MGGAVRARAAAAPLASAHERELEGDEPPEAAGCRILPQPPDQPPAVPGAEHAERDQGADLHAAGSPRRARRGSPTRRRRSPRARCPRSRRRRTPRARCSSSATRPSRARRGPSAGGRATMSSESAEPDRRGDDVENERDHGLVVVRLLAGMALRAHRHERCDREDRHEECRRPRAHCEGQNRDRRRRPPSVMSQVRPPSVSTRNLPSCAPNSGPSPRAGLKVLTNVRNPVDGGRDGEDRCRDRCQIQRRVELALPRLEREQRRHERADHARCREVDHEGGGRQTPAHKGSGVADREGRGAAADDQPPDQSRERDHDEDRGTGGPQRAGRPTASRLQRRAVVRVGITFKPTSPDSAGRAPTGTPAAFVLTRPFAATRAGCSEGDAAVRHPPSSRVT